MLIYDHTKALIGIDDDDLHLLGFNMAKELFGSCTDVADFFVKEPGYIHNFKNFEWIDFVLHAEAQHSRAIVDTGRNRFTCEILIRPFHLLQTPDREAYAVYLQHVQPLKSGAEKAPAAEPEAPRPAAAPRPETAPPAKEPAAKAVELPKFDDVAERTLGSDLTFEPPVEETVEASYETPETLYPDFGKPLEIEEDLFLPMEEEAVETEVPQAVPAETPKGAVPFADYLTPDEQAYAEPLETFQDYHYNPLIAAEELGLPVDLIEEFLGDFITQAHEFHDPMYGAASKDDYENLKLLSHKLKGVAANLRIEDAFTMLSTINTSHNHTEVQANLKMFYNTLAKLEGKEPPLGPVPQAEAESAASPETAVAETPEPEIPETVPAPQAEEDIYTFDVKEVTRETAAAPAAEQESAAEEDIYAFDIQHPEPFELAEESTESEEAAAIFTPEETAAFETEELYDFEKEAAEQTPAEYEPPKHYGEPEFHVEPEIYAEPEFPWEPAEAEPEEIPETAEEPEAAVPAYDVQGVANELGLPVNIVEELRQDFIDHAESCRKRFDEAMERGEPSLWRGQAVQMKGIADNLRMNDIAMMMQELESTEDTLHAKALIEQFYRRVKQL